MKGRLKDADPDALVTGFATDSRAIEYGNVFLAIRGENVDGHDYVSSVSAREGFASVVERPESVPRIEVENIVSAIARFGRSIRDEFSGPVVGITGSNGKTSTKELTSAALSCLGPVLKNEGNRNSEYTSPLVWFDKSADHRAAVIEMGMRGFGQIAHLAEVARPTVGIITCIGTAHMEMVGSREGIAKAKGELLERLVGPSISVLWHEDDFLSTLKEYATGPVVTFGFDQGADVRVIGYRALSFDSSEILLDVAGDKVSFELGVLGRHQALNSAAAVAAAVACGCKASDAAAKLVEAVFPPMRMQVVECHGVTLVVDTYNASPDSTVAALRALCEVPCQGRRHAVLGEMRELGSFTESGHRMVGVELAKSSIDTVLLTGGPTQWIS
ncbi:MAG: UDP-N-acetylmuramoyl-tripeptide--D-alanyl-D-alanine ligase [Armatimonadota bacterium]